MYFNILMFIVNTLDAPDTIDHIGVEFMAKPVGIMDIMYLLIVLACVGLTLALEDDQLYCGARYTHLCLGKGQHVACQFPVAGSGPNCQNYSKIKFNSDLRNYITNFINKRRQRIAAGHERVRGGKHIPAPQVMMYVEWDYELARLAQRLADQCYFVHDECRATVRYPYAGQSVGEVRWRHLSNNYDLSAQRGIRRVFDAWWGERRRVEPHLLTQPFRLTDKGVVWGHFSQLAVWTLRAVGCGAVRHGEDYPRLLLVCDFSHTNMLGEKTLIPGESAPCPDHTRRKSRSNFPLLCSSVKEQIKNSRVLDDDNVDEPDYNEGEDPTSDVMAVREELKRLGPAVTERPWVTETQQSLLDVEEEEWRQNRLRQSEQQQEMEGEETITGADVDNVNNEDDEAETPTTPDIPRKKRPTKKMKIKFKSHATTDKIATGEEEDYRKFAVVSEKRPIFEPQEKIMPTDMRAENDQGDEDNEDQETLILTGTSSPLVLDYKKTQRRGRIRTIVDSSTLTPKTVNNQNIMYNPRNRWKPERERRTRPGAAALLRPDAPPIDRVLQPAIPPRIAFRMDDDDVEQLHADTGFKPSWKTNSTPVAPRSN